MSPLKPRGRLGFGKRGAPRASFSLPCPCWRLREEMAAVIFSAQHDGGTSRALPVWCCGSLGLGHPACPQMGHEARPHHFSCLQLPPCCHRMAFWRCHPLTSSPRFPGRNLGAVELRGDSQPRGESSGMAGSKPTSGRTHTASSYHSPGCDPGRENIPQLPKGLHPPLGATVIISTAHALPWGWHWEPVSHTHPCRDTAFSAWTSLC